MVKTEKDFQQLRLFLPSLGHGAMQLNYLQKQAGESKSVVTERRFGSGFHSRSGFQLPSPSSSMRADFLEKGGQRR